MEGRLGRFFERISGKKKREGHETSASPDTIRKKLNVEEEAYHAQIQRYYKQQGKIYVRPVPITREKANALLTEISGQLKNKSDEEVNAALKDLHKDD